MLSSRLEAVFDEFLSKVKEEFQMAKTVDGDQKKIRKNSIAPNYGYRDEKSSRLDDHPSFTFKKRNLLPGWYAPLQNLSAELKTKYPKKFGKFEKNLTNVGIEGRDGNINRRTDELRNYREYRKCDQPAVPVSIAEPNLKKCICKHHKSYAEHIYDLPAKSRFARNSQNFRAEGTSVIRPKTHAGHMAKKVVPMSAFTLTSVSSTHSSS
ncbi:hypothetical protein HA402_004438 [Bradysia odoriphaga]|nr:hypothetical protein HA402_004438 [Bradysia odoriphaga]